jgi:hypothetical protein
VNTKHLFKNYGLGIVLFALFIFSWVGHAIFQWKEFVNDQNSHNQSAELNQFIPDFLRATFENWQSEFLQLFAMVVLTSVLSFKGSPESKDSEEKVESALSRIERRLETMSPKRK